MWEKSKNEINMQNFDTEYGTFYLGKINSNRGNWRHVANVTKPEFNFLFSLIPSYFFDECTAKLEVQAWLTIARRHTDFSLMNAINNEAKNIEMYFNPSKIYHGKLCMVTIGKNVLQIVNTETKHIQEIELAYTNVVVPLDLQAYFSLDSGDRFPRIYNSPINAELEAEAWLKCRNQFQAERTWHEL